MSFLKRLKNLWELSGPADNILPAPADSVPPLGPEADLKRELEPQINNIFEKDYEPPYPAIVTKERAEDMFPEEKVEVETETQEENDTTGQSTPAH